MEVEQVENVINYHYPYSLRDIRLVNAELSPMVGFIMLSSLSWKSQKMLMAWFTEILSVGNNPFILEVINHVIPQSISFG